jgi:hypothetical protein
MGAGIRRGSPSAPFRPELPETLRALYEQYCEAEARDLMELLPREGRRALVRACQETTGALSVEAVRKMARALLPLPPYEAWVRSYLEHREAYLRRLGIPSVPAREGPVTVAIRPLRNGWWAHLNLRRVEDGWVGFVAFHREEFAGGVPPRTADIFRGPDAETLRQRFEGFGTTTMEDFLRSVTL